MKEYEEILEEMDNRKIPRMIYKSINSKDFKRQKNQTEFVATYRRDIGNVDWEISIMADDLSDFVDKLEVRLSRTEFNTVRNIRKV